MTGRAAILAAGLLNVAVLVATSEAASISPQFVEEDTVELGSILLDAEHPMLIVEGVVEIGPGAHSRSLELRFLGVDALYPPDLSPEAVVVSLYELPEGADEVPEGATPIQETEPYIPGGPYSRAFDLGLGYQDGAEDRGPTAFRLALVLEGEAALQGALSLMGQVVGSGPEGLRIELTDVELQQP
jgi:hypothetical protein